MISEPNVGSTSAIVAAVERHTPIVLDLAQRICLIPAPTFSEECSPRRAATIPRENGGVVRYGEGGAGRRAGRRLLGAASPSRSVTAVAWSTITCAMST